MTITLQLDFLGWIGFCLMILFALGAVYLVISAMFLRSHGDYDFGTPILFAGKFLFQRFVRSFR